ncbi:hypothetical protein BGZ97_001031 [Linnemannia gamsii]|uniref:C2 domain-containing protein n=1 Tax=Linnemannia gamsii TaxID=64522 RepID=A0A9P6RGW3_9FUNG|nr:hypothetical protein BGZ97_001031 [Linnemannia gamsii]
MQRFLNAAVRNNAPTNMNKPLPEPLVDPDEGKIPIGELVIIPIQGRDLPNRERFGKQDPFILFKLGNVAKRSTTDIRGGQRPRWKDDQINIFMYESDAKDATSLYVTCLDEDPQKNDLIGDCVINMVRVMEYGEQDDWFQLSYKGREAGELLLQLTYYSHDPKHPTHKSNRTNTAPTTGVGARRPIHPVKETKKPEEKPEERDSDVDEGPVYKPPVVPEPATPQVPMVAPVTGYPYGTLAPGAARPVSPSGGQHYVGHHTPQIPPAASPYGQPAVPVNPYGAANAFPGYPSASVPYVDPSIAADPNKRHSFPGQAPLPGGFPPAGYPSVGGAVGPGPVYPPHGAVPGVSAGPGGFPVANTGFPPQGNVYPPGPGASPYAPAQPLPITQNMGGAGPGLNGPPGGYPFGGPAGPGVYPPNSNSSNNSSNSGGFNSNNGGNFNNNNNSGFNNNNAGFNNNNNNTGFNNNGGNNFNNNNGGNFNNGGFNNSNNNNSNRPNNNFNSNNGGNNNFNNGINGGNNFNNNNNGGNFNSNNNGGNFNNNNNNFNNNRPNNNFNNGGNNNNNNFNNNNGGNNFNNNNNNFNNNNSNFNSNNNNNNNNRKNTIQPTPIPIVNSPVPVAQRAPGESMYGPGGL